MYARRILVTLAPLPLLFGLGCQTLGELNALAQGLQREAFARRVAEYVRDNYPSFQQLEQISVGFEAVRKVGPVSTRNRETAYVFNREELQ